MKFTNIFFNSNFFDKNNQNLDLFELIKKAAFFHQDSAGIYSTLSLGYILEEKINKIIEEELYEIGF
jgi:prolyl-tRNA synthetase